MVCSGFREYEVKKIVFFFLQQAGEGNFFTSYSQNPERTIKCTPINLSLGGRGIRQNMDILIKFSKGCWGGQRGGGPKIPKIVWACFLFRVGFYTGMH